MKIPLKKFPYIIPGTFIFILLILPLYFFFAPWKGEHYQQGKLFIYKNQDNFHYVLTTVFDKAANCHSELASASALLTCQEEVSSEIHTKLPHLDQENKSLYFIRLRDKNRIEKLFLSGKYSFLNYPIVDATKCYKPYPGARELCMSNHQQNVQLKRVISLLNGWGIQLPTFSSRFMETVRSNSASTNWFFLLDFPSEYEIIIPYKRNGEVVGALVRLHGD